MISGERSSIGDSRVSVLDSSSDFMDNNPGFAANIDGYIEHARRKNIICAEVLSDPQRRQVMEAALAYMGLKPGESIEGTPVDWVFIGSCTNGRLSDIREAARVVAGRKVAPNVRAWVVPGSEATQRAAEREGLDKIFLSAGFEWRKAGCSMCAGINGDTVAPGQRSVSTTNRNFVGRQGPNARTHLASPAMAAAAAITGRIADTRKLG